MRDAENIRAVARLAPDMMGFIFYERSPRNASALDPAVVKTLPHTITRVGVFVNESQDQIIEIVSAFGLTHLQLHGDESVEFCRTIAQKSGCTIIKATTPEAGQRYDNAVDILLFDTPSPLRGGTGERFDWRKTELYTGSTPWMLSGGVSVEHINELILKQPFAVDLNSRFEIEPGIKNIELLETFILKIRDHEQNK